MNWRSLLWGIHVITGSASGGAAAAVAEAARGCRLSALRGGARTVESCCCC